MSKLQFFKKKSTRRTLTVRLRWFVCLNSLSGWWKSYLGYNFSVFLNFGKKSHPLYTLKGTRWGSKPKKQIFVCYCQETRKSQAHYIWREKQFSNKQIEINCSLKVWTAVVSSPPGHVVGYVATHNHVTNKGGCNLSIIWYVKQFCLKVIILLNLIDKYNVINE